ncbi:MAG: hypothetical protein ABIG32_04155 [Candidatus Uhrbacteria bacterium]|nr:hypothetical protein [Patescibacteria group bacterium]MBU1906732.1 hypothetical protein [Patescibacteria group bacterium]
MSKTPKYDAKVSQILDSLQPGERVCDLSGKKWEMTEREIGWYKKFNVPPSKYSPLMRQKLEHSYFIMNSVWYNKHYDTGEPVPATTHPASGIRVLPDKEWFDRDFTSLAQELEIDQPFFDQLYKLSRAVPRAAGFNYVPPENSVAFISFGDKDSYFVIACKSKRTYHSQNAYEVEDCAEMTLSNNAQNCYQILRSDRAFNCKFLYECKDCVDCVFSFDCRNCEKCFGATNKRNKKYLFFNEQLSAEQWEARVAKIDLSSYQVRQEYEQKYLDLIRQAVWPENWSINAEDSTGDYLYDVSNCYNCYYTSAPGSRDCEDCTYFEGGPSQGCYSIAATINSSNCYYGIGVEGSNLLFGMSINVKCDTCEYCELCYECSFCFGCTGLRHKKYCILNQQYTEQEYWKILDQLKCVMLERGEYGDMPPAYFSTQVFEHSGAAIMFGADETDKKALQANDIKPADEGAEGPDLESAPAHSTDEIPDRIAASDIDEIAGKVFLDREIGRRFSYIKPELELYLKLGIAPPRIHFTSRANGGQHKLNMPIFHEEKCHQCAKVVSVADNLTFPERKIFCKPCYLTYLEQYG